ncbi:hypothetical protein ACKUSY_04930 [Myroides odoratus]
MFTRKIINFAVILLLSTFIFSCSSDDASTTEDLTLTLKANVERILLGEEVSFEVLDNKGKSVTNATILVDDKAIVGNTYKAAAVGTFKAVATKANYRNSQALTITVATETLTVTANKETVKVNEKVTFSAINSEQKDFTATAIFYVNNKPIEGNIYTVLATDGEYLTVYAENNHVKSNEIAIQIEQEQEQPKLEQIIRGKWKLSNAASHDIIYNFYEGDTFDFVYFGTLMQGDYRIIGDKIHLDVISSGLKMTDYSIITIKEHISVNELDVLLTVSGIHEQGQSGRLIRQKEDVALDIQQLIGTWKAELNGQKIFTITFNDNGTCSVIQAENTTGIPNIESVQYMSKYEKYSTNTVMLENRNGAYTYYLTVEEFTNASELKATLFEYVLFPQKANALILKKM